MKIGYARISRESQNLQLQKDALIKAGCSKIYQDSASGVKSNRPGLLDALEYLRKDDELIVWRLDRLGRTPSELISMVKELGEKGIQFTSLTENIDTTTSGGKFIFGMFCHLAEHERNVTIERTYAGLESARARGRIGGRRFSLNESQIDKMMILYNSKSVKIKEISDIFNISDRSIYNYKKRFEARKVA